MRPIEKIRDEMLVVAAQGGNKSALGRLIGYRSPRLLAHATRLMGNRDEALDICQEAWIDIIKGLPKLKEPRAFPAWSTRIVTRKCARFIKKKIRHKDLLVDVGEEVKTSEPIDFKEPEDFTPLRRAIRTLPNKQAAAIALFYLEEMSVAEVSIALDVPIGTVKSRLMKAREKLKITLNKQDGEQYE